MHMKIKFLTSAFAAILGLALASVPSTVKAQTATNATAPAAPSTATKEKKSDKTHEGSITAIDATSLAIANTKGKFSFAITPATTFLIKSKKEKTPATQADFAVGDRVRVSYKADATGALTAVAVSKKPAKAAAAAPAAPAAQ
jgi:hypothetical protein